MNSGIGMLIDRRTLRVRLNAATLAREVLYLGAHQRGQGVNFALFSRHATRVRLDCVVP